MAKKFEPKDLGIQSTPAGFNIPKIKKDKSKGELKYVQLSDRESTALIREVDHTCLDRDLKIRKQWSLKAVSMVSPAPVVETRYREKRAEMKEQGGSRLQQEVFGFYICRDRGLALEIARTGIKANPYVKGYLGDPSHGVYLFRYLDVALLSQRESKNASVLVFKVLQGRAKQIPVTEGSTRMVTKEPTPNFDCHISQSAPLSSESVFSMCSKSQMYVYEYTEDAVPAECPRQCLPYALLEFSNSGDWRVDAGTSAIGPKSVSASAASAGWSSIRRPSSESTRKAGPAGQPMPLPTPLVLSSDADVFSSSTGKETQPSVVGGSVLSTDTGTWWAPVEVRDSVQPVAMELTSTADKPADQCEVVQPHHMKYLNSKDSNNMPLLSDSRAEHDVSASASNLFGQGSVPVSAAANRDPRLLRLSRSDRPSNPSGSDVPDGVGEHPPRTTAQKILTSVQTLFGQRKSMPEFGLPPPQAEPNRSNPFGLTWSTPGPQGDSFGFVSLIPSFGKESQSVVQLSSTSVSDSRHSQQDRNCGNYLLPGQGIESSSSFSSESAPIQDPEDNLNTKKAPHIPCLDRAPAKSALKKPTATWPSPQVEGSKKKKTLSYQDYLKKKKAEAQANPEVKETVKSTNLQLDNNQQETVKCLITKSSEELESLSKSVGFRKEEFQGCDFIPPEMSGQNEHSFKSSSTDLSNRTTDTVTNLVNSSEKLVPYPHSDSLAPNSKSVRRDPRLHSSYLSSANSQKVASHESNEDSEICKKLEGVAPEHNVADESEQDQATDSPQELPSDSLKSSSAAQDQSTDSKEQKDLDNHCTGENSVSKLLDIANHQVLFADIEETENENALRMFIDDVPPADCSPEGEDGAGSTSDQEQTNDEDPPTAVVRSAGDGDSLVPGKDEAQDGVSVTGIKVEITDGHWSRLSAMQLSSVKEEPKSIEDTHFEKWQPSFISQNTTSVRQSCPSLLETEPTTEPAFREGVRVTHEQKDERLLSRLAKGLKERLATLGKNVSPSSGANEIKKTGAQTPNMDSFSRKKDDGSPSSESAVPASSPLNDQKVSSEDAAFDCAEEARTGKGRKSACGKKHKTKSKQKGKKTCDCETESNVDYAMLRLAKGLRPGKTIHVGGLGKNPTDDPLPVLEGKRRRKKNQEAKKDKGKTNQTGNEERHPQYQKVAKKPRKKRKGTLGPGRRRGRKKAAQMLASSGNEDEIDYTDFQFEEPQDFRVSISDSMEMVNRTSCYPAAESVVKVEPGEEGFSFNGKTRRGTEASDGWGPALPLSYLGLQHWTEALLLPSLNPQVALVDFFKACKGLADFDNCEICQKVIDQRLIEDDDQRSSAAEDTTTLDSGTTSLDGPENVFPQAETESELSELKEKGLPGEACANEGSTTSGDRTLNEESSSSLDDDVGLITKSVSQNDHNTKSESQAVMPVEHSKTNEETFKEIEGIEGSELLTPELEQMNIPRSVKDISLARSSSAVSESVIGTGNHSSNDHSSTQRIEEETPSGLPAPLTDGTTEMAREGTEACSQVEQKLKVTSPSVRPAPLLSAKDSIVPPLQKLPSDTSSSPPSTQEENALPQDNQCQKNIKTGGSPCSQSPFSFSTTRSARPRTTFSVCSQGSTKHCWQLWKFNQAQQMQLKTSNNMDNMRTSMSGIDSDEGQNICVPQDQADVTDNHENNVNRDHTDFPVSSSSDRSAPEDASGHLEKLENTSVKSVREKNVSCNSDSSASVQNRQSESYLESGYWLGINELTSLHQSQEDSVKLKDKTEIFSRSASKISPTKLSRLKPGNEALQLPSTAPSWSSEVASGDLSHQTHVLTDDVGSSANSEQTDEKMQGHVEKVAADSTQVTALSDVPLSTELANKNTGSSVSSKPINSCGNPYLTGLNRRDDLQSCDKSSDSLNQSRKETTTLFVSSEDLNSISDNLPVTPGHSKKEAKCILSPSFSVVGEKPRASAEQHGNGIVHSESYTMTASKIGEESRDDPLAHLHSQAELLATSKQILAEIEKSKSSTAVPQFGKGASAWLYQQQATCALPEGKSTHLFDSIIRDKGSLTRKHHSSIPGLDLLTSTDTEEATSTEPSVNVDSIRFEKGTPEEMQGLNDDSQQCKEVYHSLESHGDEMGDITQNSAELKRSQQETLTGTALETVLETSAKAVYDKEYSRNATLNMNEELDIVGTPGISTQNKNRLGSKLKPLSLVCHSLERKKENTNKGSKGYLGDEKSDIDDLQSLDKGDSGKTVEGNALELDDEKSNEGTELTGCPIPSFTRTRANQKGDRKDVKKQFDILKGSGMDNSRNIYNKIVHSQSMIPAVQTSVYDQPPPPGVDVENSPQMTNFGQFYGNLPHSQFHYMPPVQQQPVVVNTIFAPRVSVPPPDVLSSSMHRSSVTDPTSICNSNPVVISEPDKSASSEGGQHMLFPPQMVPPVFTTLPPAPAPVPATCLPLPDSVTVSLVTSSTSQIFSASTSQVCVTAADSSHDSAAAAPPITSSSSGPTVRTDDMNRDLSVQKAEVDVISWFAKRMAAEKNPPKKDVMDWFSDIIDKKRSVSSLSDLEPELKKAKIDFMESMNQKKKNMCEPKEKVGDSSGQIDRKTTPCESRVVGKKNPVTLKRQTSSCSSEGVSGTKKPKNSISKVSFKVGLSYDGVLRKRGPLAKSVDLGSLSDSDELPDSTNETQQIPNDGKSRSEKQRYNETQQIPSDVKSRSDKQRYNETQQIPSDGKSRSDKQRYNETQQIPSDGKSRSDKQRYSETQQIPSDGKSRSDKQRYSETQQIPSDGKSRSDKQRYSETQQLPSDGKSRSDKQRSKNHSSEVCGKIVMDIVKDTEKQDADIPDARCANSGKEMRKSSDKNKDNLKAVKASSENRKRLHSRWDQKTTEPKSSVQYNTDAQQNDSDDDMIDYAHALLEGDLKVKSLEPISNRISDSILKSTSTPKASEADDEPSISQQSSDVLDKKPAGQKETKVGKSKSNLTDKPLEFLLFAKEMIMQKLQEEEENEPVTTAMCPSDADSVRNQENRLFDESDVDLPQQKTSQKLGAKSDRVTSEKEEHNKESGLEWEQPIPQSHRVSETASSATVFAKTKEEVNRSQGIGYWSSTCAEPEGKIATSYLTAAGSERKESNTCVAPETSTAESKSLPYALNAANIAAITEEEINKLKNIVCQLTSLPVTNPNDKPSAASVLPTSAKKDDKVAPTFGGKEQKTESISSETKNPQGEKAKTQGNRHRRSNAAGRDWSLFLTTPRSTYRRLLTGASEKRNFYGDIIQPPVFMDESVQVQSVHTSTDFHGHSHFASKPVVQTEYGASFENAAMARLAAPQKTSFQCFSHSVQIESQTKPEMSNRTVPADTESFTDDQTALMKFLLSKTCASKADNSDESKTFLGGSGGSLMQNDKLQSESALQTNSLRTKEQSELDATSSPAVRDVASAQQKVIESSATMQYASASKDLSSAEALESASSTSSALNPHSMTKLENVLQGKHEVKTLRDFLLENFPGEDTESLSKLLDYKLTADVNIMNNKMKKDIICRIRKHLENVHPVSTSSTNPANETTPQTHLLLEEFAVDQIELELRLVEGCLRLLEATQAIQTVPDQGEASSDGQSLGDSVPSDSHVPVKDALSVVLQDFNGAMKDLDRVCRGRPHQRIPTELLLPDEQDRMYTKEGAFTILLSSIPSTAFQKLLQCKTDIEACLIKICRAATTNQTFLLQQEKLRIHQFRAKRLQMLRTFTGTVSANRLKKVTTIRDYYTTSQLHLHQVLGERSVAKMVFFSASLAAIQNHLQILEKEMK